MSYIAKNGRLYTSGASEALTLLDDKFSVNKSYSKGDSCIYNDYLWKFTSDKSAGEWDSSVVEQCRIMDFVDDVNVRLTQTNDKVDDVNGKLIVPDYANAKLLDNSSQTSSFDFIAPQNGFLLAGGYGSNQSNSYIIFRPAVYKAIQFETQGISDEYIGALFPVAKGDVIEITTSLATKNNGTYFIPSKQ